MKKKNNSNFIIIFLFLCSLSSLKGIGQSHLFISDTVYLFLCKGTLENSRPIASYLIVKDLTSLAKLSPVTVQDSFVCILFKQSILFEEPVFTLSKNAPLYEFKSKKQKTKYLKGLLKRIYKLNDTYSLVTSKVFTNGRSINLQCLKLIGEFWSLTKNENEVNNYDHSFLIAEGCYTKNYIFNLKNIKECYKLSEIELNIVQNAVR